MKRCRLSFWMLAWSCVPGGVAAEGWSLPEGSRTSVVSSGATLYGAPAELAYYEAPLNVPDLIAHLEKHPSAPRDLSVFPGMAVLSNFDGPCARVMTLTGAGMHRSRGTLSTICWDHASAGASAPPAWLPAGATLAFDFSEPAALGGTVQQIWRYELAPDVVDAQARAGLAKQGWKPVATRGDEHPSSREWTRGKETLVIDILGRDTGCALAYLRFGSSAVLPIRDTRGTP
jgi:hypothetical protein